MKGKIVLVPFPFTDLSATKLRPALVLVERKSDCVLAFISSNLPQELSASDILVPETHQEFLGTGLRLASVIKLDKVATISKTMILGEIGALGEELRKLINTKLPETYRL